MSNKSIVLDQKVKLRKRKLPSGNVALFLDYVQNDTRMRESLGLTLYPGTTASIKEKNQRTLLKAEAFRIEKEKERYDLTADNLEEFQKKYSKLFSDTFKNQEPVEGNKLLNAEILKK